MNRQICVILSLLSLFAACGGVSASPDGSRFSYFGGLDLDPSVPSPSSVLGHEIGDHFTRHADMMRYLELLASRSDRVQLRRYGRSVQGRPLAILTLSDPSNLSSLDEILARNRALADPRGLSDAGRIQRENPGVVWLSYGVHGNEPSAMETGIQVAYTLCASRSPEVREILRSLVVVVDPCLNPDGHERYVSWYQNARGAEALPHPDATEHHEPWPGGRSNHYMFDLNRDWVWLVQAESAQRLPVYREYLPQLHIDYHEQEYTRPYFFGSGDTPYNTNLPASLKEWTDRYGEANAAVFDARGLLYSTKERFDYLYPGYGKVLPCYHGAVGMLCEQGGHSRAGEAIEIDETYTLTLGERVRNHFLTSMSYLESTASWREELLVRFTEFFGEAVEGVRGAEWGFFVSSESDASSLGALWRLCEAHGIEVERLDAPLRTGTCLDYWSGSAQRGLTVPEGSWLIRTRQPMGRLVKAMFERASRVEDIETYDITAWSVPLVFGLRAWYTFDEQRVESSRLTSLPAASSPPVSGDGEVALIVDRGQGGFARAVGAAGRMDLRARFAGKSFVVDGVEFGAGALVVHFVRNDAALMSSFERWCVDAGVNVHRASTGLTTEGPALGANANKDAVWPEVLLVRGSPLSSLSYGALWHHLDVASPLPYTPVDVRRLGRVDLDRYNVVLLPDGGSKETMQHHLGEDGVEQLRRWLKAGGVLVAVGSSGSWANAEFGGAEVPESESESEKPATTYEQRRTKRLHARVPGALLWGVVDVSHPLGAGLDRNVALLRRGTRPLPVASGGVGLVRYHSDRPVLAGVGSRKSSDRFKGGVAVSVHAVGSGRVIGFADDPVTRGFMRGASRVLDNVLMYGASQ